MRIPIAREGFPFIAAAVLAALLLPRLPGLGLSSWLLWPLAVFITSFFRDPERRIPQDPGLLLSPADGTVVRVEAIQEPAFVGGPCTLVSIFMSPLNCHINRSPVTGTVQHVHHKTGLFRMAYDHRATDDNEQNWVGIEAGPLRILVRQVAGFLARRIVCRVAPGDVLAVGERFGMIRFGSRVDVYVPPAVELRVRCGERVYGGTSVLGVLR